MFPGGYNVKLYISRGRLAWWLLAFLHSGYSSTHLDLFVTILYALTGMWVGFLLGALGIAASVFIYLAFWANWKVLTKEVSVHRMHSILNDYLVTYLSDLYVNMNLYDAPVPWLSVSTVMQSCGIRRS